MNIRRIYVGSPNAFFRVWGTPVVVLLVAMCQQVSLPAAGQDKPASPESTPSTEAKPDEQLEINRNALLAGPSEQIRIKAALVMLSSEDPLARKILIDTLKQAENSAARAAVCKALIQMRVAQKPIENKQEFIQPLLQILTTDDSVGAELAAEATLIFRYEQIRKGLEAIVTESSLPVKARLNAIYALKLQPDMRVIFTLMALLDDSESQVAAAAEAALHSLGIPVGEDVQARQQIVDKLKRQGPEAFLRDRLTRRETEIRKLENELNLWRQRYRSALDRIYDAISEDEAKGKFLAEHLVGSEPIAKLWALEKVAQRRRGTNPQLPVEIGPILINLISDPDPEVRLKIARVLALMGELNSAQPLAEQLKVEPDDEVRMELFVALGGACYYASLPDAKFKIPKEVREQALEWAVKYLSEQEPKKAQKGAEVMKKLLEQGGLESAEVNGYLDLLTEKFNQQTQSATGTLRGELLSVMAGLCAPQSVCSAQARKRFKPLFEEALSDKTDLVREAAVDGLIYIDKAGALRRLRKDFVNDPSAIVRGKLIALAGEIGATEDLVWLVEKIGSNSESESAWQAMLKIFNNSDADVLNKWIDEVVSQNSQTKLSDEQKIPFLEIAQRKATGESKPEMLKNVRQKLADLYIAIGQFERAAEYLGLLRETAQTVQEKEAILSDLLVVYLRWPKVELGAKLVENCLLEKDLDPNNVIVRSIDDYLSNPSPGADPNTVLKALAETKLPQNRPKWRQQLKKWAERLSKAENGEKPRNNGK
ncbi:MAG: HEAT repeat domain-containing protein [Sedimentisphaerales bacterium]